MAGLRRLVGGRKLLVRVDRTELSKNIVRGLLAYRDLLRRHPEWQGRVVHIALAYPSRHDLPEYREYSASVQRVAKRSSTSSAAPTGIRSSFPSTTITRARSRRIEWPTSPLSTRFVTG